MCLDSCLFTGTTKEREKKKYVVCIERKGRKSQAINKKKEKISMKTIERIG